MKNIKQIVLVGAEGFLGKNLGNFLHSQGYEIIGIDIQKAQSNLKYKSFIQKNILDLTLEDMPFLNTDDDYGLIHVGGVSRNGVAAKFPVESSSNTLTSLVKLLELLEVKPPKWMALTSTREVEILLEDKESIKAKQRIYPTLKLATELIAESYQGHWKIPLKIFRLSDIFGGGDHPSKVMQIFLNKAIKNEDINVMEPEVKLFLTEVKEVSNIIYKSINDNENTKSELINIWDKEYFISLLELAYLAKELNPNSTSKIIAPECAELNYSILKKLTPNHSKEISSLNQSLIKMNNEKQALQNH